MSRALESAEISGNQDTLCDFLFSFVVAFRLGLEVPQPPIQRIIKKPGHHKFQQPNRPAFHRLFCSNQRANVLRYESPNMLGLGTQRFACPANQLIRLEHLDSGSYIQTARSPPKNRPDGEGASELGHCYVRLPSTPIIDVRLGAPDILRRSFNEDILVSEQASIPIDFHNFPLCLLSSVASGI
jgi:hypothetical protein